MTNVFISWSGDQSKLIAEELRNWIPSVLQFAKPYFTPNDIEKGAKWSSEISKKLAESNVGIICLTKDNINKPWILFEAGALSKDLDHSRVCSILFGMDNADLTGPLTTFQATNFEKSDFKKMMLSINESGGASTLPRETFERVFDMWWPQLNDKISAILKQIPSAKKINLRNDRELLEEILLITRSYSQSTHSGPDSEPIPLGFVSDLFNLIERLMGANRKILDMDLNEISGELISMLNYLTKKTGRKGSELMSRIEILRKEQDDFIPF